MRQWALSSALGIFAVSLFQCVGDDPTLASPTNDGGSGNSSSGQSDGSVDRDAPDPSPPLKPQPMLALAVSSSCFARADGTVVCWGGNADGQLGVGMAEPGTTGRPPAVVPNLRDVVRITALDSGFCVLLADRTVSCWGSNTDAQAAISGDTPLLASPTKVPGLDDVVEIAGGSSFVCARKEDRSVWCWGSDGSSQTGMPVANAKLCSATSPVRCTFPPSQIEGLVADELAAGSSHACAREGTTVKCWGNNRHSALGHMPNYDGDKPMDFTGYPANPTPVVTATGNAARVFAGAENSCVVTVDGNTMCWGLNTLGQAGTPNEGSSDRGRNVAALSGVPSHVAFNLNGGCALQSGSLFCWGDANQNHIPGQTGTNLPATPLTIPPEAKPIVGVGVPNQGAHRCVLNDRGEVYCWGANDVRQAGTLESSNTPVTTPTKVTLPL